MNPDPNFTLPVDGWFHVEKLGLHPNSRAGIVQVIDDEACRSIVNRFNAEADKPGFAGMLIDHDHLKHDLTQETRAYGWLMRLQNRADGIYGQIRWTNTGRRAVEGGDYRYFSSEYGPKDFVPVLNAVGKKSSPPQFRPVRLSGLTLTNDSNNKGQTPITNRSTQPERLPMQTVVQNRESAAVAELSESEMALLRNREIRELRAARPKLTYTQAFSQVRQLAPHLFGLPARGSEATPSPAPANNRASAEYLNAEKIRIEIEKVRVTNRNLTYEKALMAVRRIHPELFSAAGPARDDADAEAVRNRQSEDATQSLAIRDVVDKIRSENSGMSYEKARNIARRQHPEIFGITAMV